LKESYLSFEEIHQVMLGAIKRRSILEKTVTTVQPEHIDIKEFKDLPWAKNENDLKDRLRKIKSLQLETAEKYDENIRSTFFQRVEKRRLNREQELTGETPEQQKRIVYAHVLKAMSSALDSQTHYFTPAEAGQFMMQIQQKLFGIGAQLRDDLNGFSIVRILDGGPAQNSKLKVNDRIIAVDREPVVGLDITEAVEHIRGPLGTPVLLTIVRKVDHENEETLDIPINRGEVVLKDTRLETQVEPFGDGAIGVLKLFSFYQDAKYSSYSDLLEALNTMKKEHALKGVILDLRTNAGGLLPQAVAVASLFMSKGVVVSVKDNTGFVQHLRNVDSKIAWDGPLVILVDRASASAAEIVTQTLQEYGRALIVGDPKTYGKGTFQTFTLEGSNFGKVNPKGEYKVTRGRYYTVSGKSPQLVGASSDIIVPGPFSEAEIGEQYSKFPLNTDQIGASFDDDLSDVPALHRAQVMRLYKFNLQPVLTTYKKLTNTLTSNSSTRIANNKNYQHFLKALKQNEFDDGESAFSLSGQSDLQLAEALNVMKDLIRLLQLQSA
jgi:carboxyl-terminal processing protease